MEDLIAFTEEHFARLLPFTTLGRAGEHDLRRQRRLMALLRQATGLDDVEAERRPWSGAAVMLDAAIRTRSTSGSPPTNRLRASCSAPGQRN